MREGACIADVVEGRARWHVAHCDNLFALQGMPDCCVDSVVCDPPAGIAFMGRDWDKNKGGRDRWIAWLEETMREVFRVLKPGAHGFVWALPRTSHWTAMALENAGFEIRDVLGHFFASGFPKSLDVSKSIDAAAGAEREIVGRNPTWREAKRTNAIMGPVRGGSAEVITEPATDAAREWDGWGTALKPAHEDWILIRKPIRGTVAANVTEFGTGALNVDGCRVPSGQDHADKCASVVGLNSNRNGAAYGEWMGTREDSFSALGRWPSNVVLTHALDCDMDGECSPPCPVAELDRQSGDRPSGIAVTRNGGGRRIFNGANTDAASFPDSGYTDSGGASRFFHCFRFEAKASTSEREAGCEALPLRSAGELTDREDGSDGLKSPRAGAGRASNGRRNIHPTVKPVALMRWLCKLVTPPGGVVLDVYAGSGTTGIGAVLEGFRFVGIEGEAMCGGFGEERFPHVEIARARIRHRIGGTYDIKRDEPANDAAPRQGSLFG